MFKFFLGKLCLSLCLFATIAGCNDVDDTTPTSGRNSHNGAPGSEFNPYDQQPNQTALDNH